MNNLELVAKNGVHYAESRQVAEIVGKRHADLIRDIENYKHILENAKLRSDDFFLEDTYNAGTGRDYKRYLLTKKGCDMVANKMIGEKGILFTATYIDKFYQMETKIKQPHIKKTSYESSIQLAKANALELNAKFRVADTLLKIAEKIEISDQKHRLYEKAASILAGESILSLPDDADKTYSATELGEIFGVSKTTINQLAHAHGLKVEQYGIEISINGIKKWRFLDKVIPIIADLVKRKEGAAQ